MQERNTKVIVVTGATSGIGLAVCQVLLREGYGVIGVGREETRCRFAREALSRQFPEGDVTYFTADLRQQRQVRAVAQEIQEYLEVRTSGRLSGLVHNAGCVCSWYATTEEGYEQQFALNHLASFLLTQLLLDFLLKAKGRVILTSSASHRHMRVRWRDIMFQKRYHPLLAYKQSKLCNVLFARGLSRRYGERGLAACCVDPGLVRTDIGLKGTAGLVWFVWNLRKRGGTSPDVPAKTYAYILKMEKAPEALYYKDSRAVDPSRYATDREADRRWVMSEQLCGSKFPVGD